MTLPINLASIAPLLRPGLKAVFGDYASYPEEWMELFSKHKSDKNVEYEVLVKTLPIAHLKPEGQGVVFDSMSTLYQSVYKNLTVSSAFVQTFESVDDNLYKTQFPQGARSMRAALAELKNSLAANVFNNAFSGTFAGPDGQALCSTAHPLASGGTTSNTFTIPTGLNETSLEDAIINVKLFQNDAGIKQNLKIEKLLVPVQLTYVAERILGSKFRTGTANNDINAIYHMGAVSKGIVVNNYLSSPLNWFITTSEENGLKYMERQAVQTSVDTDFVTNNIMVKAIERYCFNYSNFRCIFGSTGV